MNPLGNGNMINMFGNIQQVKGLMRDLKNLSNPMSAIQQNPQLAQVMQMCQGRNPKDMFYAMCKQKNIDPESILSQLRD